MPFLEVISTRATNIVLRTENRVDNEEFNDDWKGAGPSAGFLMEEHVLHGIVLHRCTEYSVRNSPLFKAVKTHDSPENLKYGRP